MRSRTIVFITLNEYDNLGIGYMAAMLKGKGFKTRVVDVRAKKSDIVTLLKRVKPTIVGFSVIYQYYIERFAELAGFLREQGINCHFTAGGHYASLKYEELFEFIPILDSIVRFEGEYTISELAVSIENGADWKGIAGIVWRGNGKVILNQPKPFEKDLDKFPFPLRSPARSYAYGFKFATIIAGRGCTHNCSFCNTGKFYGQFPGAVKRIRRPGMVVREMELLRRRRDCSVFLFLDDDFPLNAPHGNEWIIKFCSELKRRGLNKKILWKINCRPDEVDEETFRLMKSHGLFLVFLGIEDGTDAGLKRLNKQITTQTTINAVNILKKLEIGMDFGFMLFQPDTTFKTLNENLDFLRKICGDGYTPVTFLKMMPYYETRIENELIKEGRLKISPGIRDYDFLTEPMNQYYNFITDCFMEWLRYPYGVENISNWAGNYISVYKHYFKVHPLAKELPAAVRRLISESNVFVLDNMKELSAIFETRHEIIKENGLLESYMEKINAGHEFYKKEITAIMARLGTIAHCQRTVD
jgi:radical SAM superfamily enzyme YgiQ (UPF0313 family)